jgi:hypothetical protein
MRWRKYWRWLMTPQRVARVRKLRDQPITQRAEQSLREALLSDSEEAKKLRTNIVLRGLALAVVNGGFWLFLPITGLFWLYSRSKRNQRRRDEGNDREAMKRAAARYNCDGL